MKRKKVLKTDTLPIRKSAQAKAVDLFKTPLPNHT